MKKVISYCLFGTDPRYLRGAVKNAQLAKQYLPDWECWFYVHKDVAEELIDGLFQLDNTKIIYINKPADATFTANRFLVFADPEVEIAVSRDADARLSAREILAVQEWIDSGLDFHIMKDHPIGHSALISAGMFGARADKLRNIIELMDEYFNPPEWLEVNRNFYGTDQQFLAEKIHPLIMESCLYHSEYYHCKVIGDSKQLKFPTPNRYPDNHVGAALSATDQYIYNVDSIACMNKNGVNKYIYDFDLLEKK